MTRLRHPCYPDISSDAHSSYALACIRPTDDDIDRDLGRRCQAVHGNQDRCIEYMSPHRTSRDRICTHYIVGYRQYLLKIFMTKERLLAYTDAIIAIIITIMVLEFKTPHNAEW